MTTASGAAAGGFCACADHPAAQPLNLIHTNKVPNPALARAAARFTKGKNMEIEFVYLVVTGRAAGVEKATFFHDEKSANKHYDRLKAQGVELCAMVKAWRPVNAQPTH